MGNTESYLWLPLQLDPNAWLQVSLQIVGYVNMFMFIILKNQFWQYLMAIQSDKICSNILVRVY